MAFWLLKSDPETYGFGDLERDRQTTWDGVTNALALKSMRQVAKGDVLMIYHSGADRAVVGLAEATSNAYPDPTASDPKLVVFDLKCVKRVAKPVPLAAIKADRRFAAFELVRMARLSVMPVPAPLWKALLKMAGEG